MTSISPTNSTAVLTLLRPASTDTTGRAKDDTDLVKIANGISSTPSSGMKSASAVIGQVAVESAPTKGKVIVADLGEADSIAELVERVKGDIQFSAEQKETWIKHLNQLQDGVDAVDKLKSSDLWKSLTQGPLREEIDARRAAEELDRPRTAETIASMNALRLSIGLDPLRMRA